MLVPSNRETLNLMEASSRNSGAGRAGTVPNASSRPSHPLKEPGQPCHILSFCFRCLSSPARNPPPHHTHRARRRHHRDHPPTLLKRRERGPHTRRPRRRAEVPSSETAISVKKRRSQRARVPVLPSPFEEDLPTRTRSIYLPRNYGG